MWRQILRTVPKKLHTFCNNQSPSRRIITRTKYLAESAFFMSTATVIAEQLSVDSPSENCDQHDGDLATDIDDLQVNTDVELTFAESEEAINNLLQTLHACIQEICEQYQHCMAKQMEIMLSCMDKDPIGPHWDELTKYRVIAEDLRLELLKYKTLISTLGPIVQNEPNDNKSGEFTIKGSYESLIALIDAKTKENNIWEGKLLDVHKQSILASSIN